MGKLAYLTITSIAYYTSPLCWITVGLPVSYGFRTGCRRYNASHICIFGGSAFGYVAWRTRSFLYPFLIHRFLATFTVLVASGAAG